MKSRSYIRESEGQKGIVVRKDAWNDFNFFEFIKARFMAQGVIYPGEGSVST